MRSTLITRSAGAVALLTVLAVSGCGSGSDDSTGAAADTGSDTSSTSPDAATRPDADTQPSSPAAESSAKPDIDVTIDGDDVTPRGDRIEVAVDKPVTIHVSSDREGELHVHSSPEQKLQYGVGETDLTLTIETPGVVDVEDHVSDTVLAQLEVS